jgi:eukaryotic-like serine/threonine-protein kinase
MLASGTRLGSYEILSAIGAGGMGEVYKARDTRLDRIVAIKVLSSEVASIPDLRERFEREARTVASLNHPHICTLHDVGHQDGTDFLVMEFLEGETLEQRLKKGALPLEQALQVGIQIADALDKAHRAGIIHRDLKPGNIMLVGPGGRRGGPSGPPCAKLLDFGLAKRTAPAVAATGLSMLPTTPPNLTAQGTILGTFQYMAPEQLEGREADARTDIFAFGSVVYEMVTGRKAFEGKSQVGLIGAILEREPVPISTIQPSAPPALDRILQRCLAKDPDERWQSAGDLAAQLKWIAEPAAPPIVAPAIPAETPARATRASRVWMAVAAVLLVAAIGLGLTALSYYQALGEAPALRFSVSPPENTFFDSNPPGFVPTVSPDGRRLAFTTREPSNAIRIWVRSLDTLDPQPLQGTDGASYPFWSPDSRSIAFFAQGKLKRVDVAGGQPVTLCDAANGRGGTWNRDGVILFAAAATGPLYRVGSGGGEPVAVTKSQGPGGHRFPSFLPDGRQFLYLRLEAGVTGIFVGALDSAESKRLLAADSNALYSAPGELLFVRQGTLLRQSFNVTTVEMSGDPTPAAEQVAVGNFVGAFSVSESGVLAYRSGPGTIGNVQLGWFDRTGKLVETVGAAGPFRGVDLSPDGKRLAVHRHDGNGGDVWLLDLARRGTMTRFTFDASQDNASPVWSPDGSRIVFGSLRNGKWGLYEKAASGTGAEQLLVESDLPKMPMAWSPDGKLLAYWVSDPKTAGDQWVLPFGGDRKPSPLLQTPFNEGHLQISPNGKWIAYQSPESGRAEVYVRPFPTGEGKWQISANGGTYARWRPDGTELFYLSIASLGKLTSVKVNPAGPTFEYGDPTELFDSGYVNFIHGLNYHTYAVSPDGQRFLIPRPEAALDTEAAPAPITVVVNWTRALTR